MRSVVLGTILADVCVGAGAAPPPYRLESHVVNFGWPGNSICFPEDRPDWNFLQCCHHLTSPSGQYHGGFGFPVGCWDSNHSFDRCCFAEGPVVAEPGNPLCWAGVYSWMQCCDPFKFQPGIGNTVCWSAPGFDFDSCCYRDAAKEAGYKAMTVPTGCGSNSDGISEFFLTAHAAGFNKYTEQGVTDKVTGASSSPDHGHTYHKMYGIYLKPLQHSPIKLFEIGLGCTMALKKN